MDGDALDITVVDHDKERLQLAAEHGFHTVCIDYRNDDDLKSLGIGSQVDTLFCFFQEDSENVFLTLSARALDPDVKIIAIAEESESGEKLVAAGANKIIDTYQICGRKIFELVKKPEITQIIDQTVFGRHDLHIAEVCIPEHSKLEDTYSSHLGLNQRFNLVLIGIVDKELGDDLFFTTGERDHLLNAGDILVILGTSREIRAFKNDVAKNLVEN